MYTKYWKHFLTLSPVTESKSHRLLPDFWPHYANRPSQLSSKFGCILPLSILESWTGSFFGFCVPPTYRQREYCEERGKQSTFPMWKGTLHVVEQVTRNTQWGAEDSVPPYSPSSWPYEASVSAELPVSVIRWPVMPFSRQNRYGSSFAGWKANPSTSLSTVNWY